MATEKEVVFAKSTKFNGELVKAGDKIKVSEDEFKKLSESGLIKDPDSVKVEVKIDDTKIEEMSEKMKLAESKNQELKLRVDELEAENNQLKRTIALDKMTVKDLTSLAEANRISLDGKTDKDEIVTVLAASKVEIETETNFLK